MARQGFKAMMNELSANSDILYELSADELFTLKATLVEMFQDVYEVCKKNGLNIMLGGGSVLGSIRHQGFIPWDDDLDLLMPRSDYERFKAVFESELGERYVLSAPNYGDKSKARFPKIMKKGTTMKELADVNSDLPSGIFLDIFILDKVPENRVHQKIKGLWCNAMMYASTQAFWNEHRSEVIRNYMCTTGRGKRAYYWKRVVGSVCGIIPSWKWYNMIDRATQYNKETSLLGIPTGRKHYFGEILAADVMLPISFGQFEGKVVPLPADTDAYLKNLYGSYMEIPPVEKRERHFVVECKF